MARGTVLGYVQSLDPVLLQPQYPVYSDGLEIGRDSEKCQVILSRDYISRRHCSIEPGPDGLTLVDNESTNGSFVNGERVQRRLLREEDVISLGKAEVKHFLFSRKSGARQRELSLPTQPTYQIGRSKNADVPLMSDPTVSEAHAILRVVGQSLVIERAGSANRVFVNGAVVGRAGIGRGDRVRIGSVELIFDLSSRGLHVLLRDTRNQVRIEARGLTRQVGGRVLLRNINLVVAPGEFVGMLGPSGAGKSTLLTALCGFQPANSGEVLVNGASLYRGFDMFRDSIGYVPQDDIIHRDLTVEKSLVYTAQLRLPSDQTSAQIDQNVNSVIETLGLEHVRNNEVSRLSGGQRKRVSVGCELLTRPSIVFLDEPTSGLDPSTEEKLMKHLGQMACQGQTVIVTTHILYNLDLLDLVIILARGRLVYFGPVASVCSFFDTPTKPVTRPLDIFDSLEPDARGDASLLEKRAEFFEQKYLNSPLFKEYVLDRGGNCDTRSGTVLGTGTPASSAAPADAPAAAVAAAPVATPVPAAPPAPPPAEPRRSRGAGNLIRGFFDIRQFLIMLRRAFDLKISAPTRLIVPLVTPLLLAILTGSIGVTDSAAKAHDRDLFTQGNQQMIAMMKNAQPPVDIVAMKYEGLANFPVPLSIPLIMVMTGVFLGTLLACLEVSGERPIYLRERAVNLRLHIYLLSKLPFLFLLGLIQTFLYVVVSSVLLGLSGDQIISIIAILTAVAWASSIIGLFISTLDPTPGQNSVVLAIIAVLPQLVLAGAQGPGFYHGMGTVTKALSCALPARWGFELMLNVLYTTPAWARDYVQGSEAGHMGFRFAREVFKTNFGALGLIGLVFFLASCISLKRYDKL